MWRMKVAGLMAAGFVFACGSASAQYQLDDATRYQLETDRNQSLSNIAGSLRTMELEADRRRRDQMAVESYQQRMMAMSLQQVAQRAAMLHVLNLRLQQENERLKREAERMKNSVERMRQENRRAAAKANVANGVPAKQGGGQFGDAFALFAEGKADEATEQLATDWFKWLDENNYKRPDYYPVFGFAKIPSPEPSSEPEGTNP